MDIAIINTHLLTLQGSSLGIIDNGGIGIVDDEIVFVGKMSDFDYQGARYIIDGSRHITMPGLINVHFHSTGTLLRGGAQDVPEIEWMNKAIGPLALGLRSDPERVVLGSKLAVLEGILSGTTTFGEYSSGIETLVEQVYRPFQTRVVAAETINEISPDRGSLGPRDLYEFDRDRGEQAFAKNINLLKTYRNEELIDIFYGPQALDMVSQELLSSIRDQAREDRTGIHMHIAQGQRERIQIQERYGKDTSTVQVLQDNKLLGKNLLGAHMHDTTEKERKILVKNGVKMASCQSSIAMIDGIVPPLSSYTNLGGIAGIGTDQATGPGNHNMIREMRTGALLAKVSTNDPTKLPAWEMIKLATIGGAKALGIDKKVGSLEVGKKADIITIDMRKLNLIPYVSKPFHTFIPNLVYSANGSEVDNVIINGQIVVKDYRFNISPLNVALKEIMDHANSEAALIFQHGEEAWRAAGSYLVKMVDEGNL